MPRPLLLDNDSSTTAVVEGLRRAGWDILTARAAGLHTLTDDALLTEALALGRVVYTANLEDFARIHAGWMRDGRAHAGIIARTDQRTPVGLQLRCLERIDLSFSQTDLANQFVYLENFRP